MWTPPKPDYQTGYYVELPPFPLPRTGLRSPILASSKREPDLTMWRRAFRLKTSRKTPEVGTRAKCLCSR